MQPVIWPGNLITKLKFEHKLLYRCTTNLHNIKITTNIWKTKTINAFQIPLSKLSVNICVSI